MAELTYQERMQPSLLDRLTDHEPQNRKESRYQRVLSMRQLRAHVLRDLTWLLNTGNLSAIAEFDQLPHVATSVINYGVPDFTGLTSASVDPEELERSVRSAIISFEPRILPESLEVHVAPQDSAAHANCITFEIKGQLWAQPIPLELFVRTEVDLETSNMSVVEVAGSRT